MTPYQIFKVHSRWIFYTKGGEKIVQGTRMEAEANVNYFRKIDAEAEEQLLRDQERRQAMMYNLPAYVFGTHARR
jgi:hypothetical protein